MESFVIRRATLEDAPSSPELVMLAGPELLPCLFGPRVRRLIEFSFARRANCFSYEHSHVIDVGGRVVGLATVYDSECKKKEDLRSLLLVVRCLKLDFLRQVRYLMKSDTLVAPIREGDYYLNNLALYPEFRSRGLGTRLIRLVEEEGRAKGCSRVVLDAETYNTRAIELYERLGYVTEAKTPVLRIRDKDFEILRMAKEL